MRVMSDAVDWITSNQHNGVSLMAMHTVKQPIHHAVDFITASYQQPGASVMTAGTVQPSTRCIALPAREQIQLRDADTSMP